MCNSRKPRRPLSEFDAMTPQQKQVLTRYDAMDFLEDCQTLRNMVHHLRSQRYTAAEIVQELRCWSR